MKASDLQFRQLDFAGLETLIAWARTEGWNPGSNDAQAFWAADPDGFIGCFKEDELIGGGSIVSYKGAFGFMGLFIMKPEYRSAGLGRILWNKRRDLLLSRLRPGAAIGMDGVVAMQPFYQKGGFKKAFRDVRYVRKGQAFSISSNISVINALDIESIQAYDKECFGFERNNFLKTWLSLPESWAFKYQHTTELNGFAVIRKVRRGFKIGPLFADNYEVAEQLYQACLNEAIDQEVYLDIPVVNEVAQELVKQYKAEQTYECARMYLGTPPDIALEKVFGITSFELG
jgi:GNAT superfamily N-acetyltransferase